MWLLLGLLCFVLAVCVHAVVSRARPHANRVVSYGLVGVVMFVALAWAVFEEYGTDVRAWAALGVYALASELYVFVFTMIGSSITARLVVILRKRDMALDEIDAAFPTSGMVEDRMRSLLGNGFIQSDGDAGYSLTRKGWLIVSCFRPLRGFFRRRQPT
jgi:hypothetical protein